MTHEERQHLEHLRLHRHSRAIAAQLEHTGIQLAPGERQDHPPIVPCAKVEPTGTTTATAIRGSRRRFQDQGVRGRSRRSSSTLMSTRSLKKASMSLTGVA